MMDSLDKQFSLWEILFDNMFTEGTVAISGHFYTLATVWVINPYHYCIKQHTMLNKLILHNSVKWCP